MSNSVLNVLFVPGVVRNPNPYQKLLAFSLGNYSAAVSYSRLFPNIVSLFYNRKKIDIIHIHWPSSLYFMGRLTHIRAIVFVLRILSAKLLGLKIIWTVHNLLPHESRYPVLDCFVRKFLVRQCHGLIFHCEAAYKALVDTFGKPRNHVVIPHGNYIGCYADKVDKQVAADKLELDLKGLVFLFFGLIRDYKGLDDLIDAFKRLNTECSLIIAGNAVDDNVARITSKVCHENNIHLFLRHIPDDELPLYFSAADVLVAPYKSILTSGAVMLGLSYGLPVIAPDMGCLSELVTKKCGILYDQNSPEGLFDALQTIESHDIISMSHEALKRADSFDWNNIGRQTADFYAKCVA